MGFGLSFGGAGMLGSGIRGTARCTGRAVLRTIGPGSLRLRRIGLNGASSSLILSRYSYTYIIIKLILAIFK
jgi:hypothetical protein